jgi:hypothetical protein
MDVGESNYLDDEKVSIKIMRVVRSNEKNMNVSIAVYFVATDTELILHIQRFNHEVQLWARLWDVDKGKHILPIYGFCQMDGPYPYIVSQWQPNGTAIEYVQQNPYANHRKLVSINC